MGVDRDSMSDDLAKRTENSYATRDKGMSFPDVYKPELGIKTWFADKDEHEIDILPYRVGKYDPSVEEGEWGYFLEMQVHRNVGPRDLQFLCLEMMFKKPCPICIHRNDLRKNPPEGKRQQEQHEEKLKELKASRQTVYNIICYDNKEEEAKGVQQWQVAYFYFENHISALAKIPKSQGGGYQSFSHMNQEFGRTITFTRTGDGLQTKYDAFRFHERNYDISDDDLEECKTLDETVHIPTFEEVEQAFWDEPVKGDEAKGEPEEEEARPRRSSREAVEEDGTQARGRGRQEPEEQEETPRRGRSRQVPEEASEDVAPPRRSRRVQEEDEGDLKDAPAPRRNADITVEDEEPPPRRSRKVQEEERPKRRTRGEEESTGRPQRVGATPECPVQGGTFGQDVNEYDECETCPHWDPCLAAKSAK